MKRLYIPFWLYSNSFEVGPAGFALVFTFHSGYIPIDYFDKALDKGFTLHSILVIFQLYTVKSQPNFLTHFTFHSGYIPIEAAFRNKNS